MRQKLYSLSAIALLGIGLVACPAPTVTRGSISGKISPGRTKSQSMHIFVAGEVIVKFRNTLQATSALTLQVNGLQLARVRAMGLAKTSLFKANVNAAQTLELVQELAQRSDVEFAQTNRIYQTTSFTPPNDGLYVRQWHYDAMNVPAAWEISTGNASTVVAVADDGMLYNETDTDPKTHPDFAGKVIGGYDFISSATAAEDGDGRDANPYDNRIGLHGTHVGGTIAAATNNAVFGAGIDWNAKLLNIRVLGKGGGSEADILDGILWASGEAVAGIPNNAHPAKIINMSLGGDGACSAAEQNVFNTLAAKGTIVVVAAGNENENVGKPKAPANCQKVITVGATDPNNRRATYSNFGPRVDIMAPGGETNVSLTRGGETIAGGVFSNYASKAGTEFRLSGIEGTSMATPHIAGLLSLMVGINPNLTVTSALQFLKDNATPLATGACTSSNTVVTDTDCGAGLANAAKTLKAVKDALGGTTTPEPPAAPVPPATQEAKNYVVANNLSNPSESKKVEIKLGNSEVTYKITDLAPGNYKLVAFQDLDGDATPDPTEPTVERNDSVTAGSDTTEDIEMEPDN